MSRNGEKLKEWHDSQAGDVGQVVQHLQRRRRALATQQRMVVSLLVLLTAFTGYYFIGVLPHAQPNFGGIVCNRVHKLMPQFLAKNLDAATAKRISDHLDHCQNCRSAVNEMAPGSMPQSRTGRARQPGELTLNRPTSGRNDSKRVTIRDVALVDR